MSRRVHVAAAVIRDVSGCVLLARRPLDKHQGGLWEFPGGKVEAGESVEQALARELDEELGIRVTHARPLIQISHDYPDKQVLLDVWLVEAFEGQPHGAEGQPLVWVAPHALSDYEVPLANTPIVRAAQLPDRYLITPERLAENELLHGVERAIEAGITLVQLRLPDVDEATYRRLAGLVMERCGDRATLMLKGPLAWASDFPRAGWHLTAGQLDQLPKGVRPLPSDRLLGASCHDATELARAVALDVDFVTLSPVRQTETHPHASAIGWAQAAEWVRHLDRPVYLLGGLGPGDLMRAWYSGAQGVAAIRQFWPAEPSLRSPVDH